MSKLTFKTAEVRPLFDHAKAASKHRPTYGQEPIPSLHLVGDQGVYLMSSGIPPIAEDKDNRIHQVAYAEGTDPNDGGFEWYENKRALYGGDDGVDAVPLHMFEKAMARDSETFTITLTARSIRVH
tara:strand:+ start:173395 stop:173772 length:378 start_codon:yes stop_codon:yes gene_type:complete